MKPAVRTNIDGHTDLATRYSQVCSAIGAAGKRFSRPEGSVTLVAVSKTRSADEVRAVANLGQRDFGENQVQEAVDKIHQLADMTLSWHFIGAIQSNKCRDIAANFDWVHSIDRLKIARRLSQMRPQSRGPLNLFLQVNLQEEQTKSGVTTDNLEDLANSVLALPHIRLCGLMAIPKPATDFDTQRRVFRMLFKLQNHLRSKGLPLDCLSMGMTDDMDAAIAEGATHVRIGTAIFGPRQ